MVVERPVHLIASIHFAGAPHTRGERAAICYRVGHLTRPIDHHCLYARGVGAGAVGGRVKKLGATWGGPVTFCMLHQTFARMCALKFK